MAVNQPKPVQTQGRCDHRSQRPLAFVNLGLFKCSHRDRELLIWVFLKQEPDFAKVKERCALTKEGVLVGTATRGNTTTDPSLFSIPNSLRIPTLYFLSGVKAEKVSSALTKEGVLVHCSQGQHSHRP